jgi:hypothetical protein
MFNRPYRFRARTADFLARVSSAGVLLSDTSVLFYH